MEKLNWVLIGAGVIAKEMADALNKTNGEIYGVYSHHVEKAKAFAKEFGVSRVYETEEEIYQDPDAHILYIATPHNCHASSLQKAVSAGKHVLCEKAITVNDRQLDQALETALKTGSVVMEAMTIYHMPLYKKVREIIDSGAIGKVKMVQVNFGSCKEYDVKNRFFAKELAGGALLDIGVYAVSFARYFLESAPNVILTTPQYFETGVDEQSGIILKNSDGQMAVIALTMRAKQPKRGVIAGEDGTIEINNYPRAQSAAITYTATGKTETIEMGSSSEALCYEVSHMERAVREERPRKGTRPN